VEEKKKKGKKKGTLFGIENYSLVINVVSGIGTRKK
jgi:hypothetical protein